MRAVRDPSRARRTAFSGPACAIAYSPHTGIFSIVLLRKCAQGSTGHMIKSNIRGVHLVFFLKTNQENSDGSKISVVQSQPSFSSSLF